MLIDILRKHSIPLIFQLIALSLSSLLFAADFTITSSDPASGGEILTNDDETGIIEVGGQIITVGVAGIQANGINNKVNNAGSISTTGNNAEGILSQVNDVTIINSGSISTVGEDAHGIRSTGDDAAITNSGSISAEANVRGIQSTGDRALIINSGRISTGTISRGIQSTGADATIINSGSISVVGNSRGIRSIGERATIINSGSISTAGMNSRGIHSTSNDVTIINSGSISTTGTNSRGIHSTNPGAAISNNGSILITGMDSRGIHATGANAIINNSGLISVTGTGALAILGDGSDSTLNLLAGSHIIGAIDLGDNGGDIDTVNIYASSQSANLTLLNVENINLIGVTGFVSGNTVITVDPTGESSRSVALSGLTSSIHGVVSQRMAHTASFKPVQVAALTLSPGMLFQERKPVAWAQVFGGSANHDAEGGSLAYGTDHLGFTLGYEWDINKTRFGLLGGVVHSKTKTDMTSFKTEADSYYVGAYGHFNLGSFKLTTSLLSGYADHNNDRLVIDNLNGAEVAESTFDSFFLSPSLTLSSAYTIADRLEFRPSASLNYSVSWLDSYSESGTTNSNLNVDDRTLKVITARVQMAAAYKLDPNSEFEFRVGLSARHNNDDDTDVSIAGNAYSYTNASDESVSGHFAGINLRVANQDNLTLMVDMEFGGDSDEDYVNGEISLEYSF